MNAQKIKFLSWFQEVDKSYLMSKGEQKKFNVLPEKVTIYRGVNNPKYKRGFSWTLDKRIAYWFANRYENKESYVYECAVNKEDIICYFEIRNEKEAKIDPKVLKEYEIKAVN